jgi:hypothetical protein
MQQMDALSTSGTTRLARSLYLMQVSIGFTPCIGQELGVSFDSERVLASTAHRAGPAARKASLSIVRPLVALLPCCRAFGSQAYTR